MAHNNSCHAVTVRLGSMGHCRCTATEYFIMKIRAIVFVALVVMSIAPRHASAQAIGISSSTYRPVIYRGDVLHEEFVLSRSEPGGDLLFHVQEEEESGLIDLHGQDGLTILNGENTAVFSYDINASAVAIGEYDTTITFVVVPQGGGIG